MLVEEEGAASALGLKGTAAARRGRRRAERFTVETFGDDVVDAIKEEEEPLLDAVVARAQHPGAVATVTTRISSARRILYTRKQEIPSTQKLERSRFVCERNLRIDFASCEPSDLRFTFHRQLLRRFFLLWKNPPFR